MSFDENIQLPDDGDHGILNINPRIFSLEVIYSATYTFLDRAYFVFNGDPDEEIRVKVKPKSSEEDIKELLYEIQNELVNYAVYIIQSSRTQEIRNAIIKRALNTNGISMEEPGGCESYAEDDHTQSSESVSESGNEMIGTDEDFEDEMGIAEPWSPENAEGLAEETEKVVIENRKVVIDKDSCIDCGTCVTIDPDNFVTVDGEVKVTEDQEPTEKTREAYKNCPMEAIELEEE